MKTQEELQQMVHDLLHNQMIVHKLPWRIEQDWTFEVTASDGYIVAKCQTHAEAQNIIDEANAMNERSKELDKFLEGEGIQ
jgi:hypothetical protein